MKLNHLMANNFMRLNLIDIDLGQSTAHLFAADNDQGKTSIQRALRFAINNERFGITLKKDYKKMVRDGAKSGMVAVTLDQTTWKRDIKTAELQEDVEPLQTVIDEALKLCLDPGLFGSLKPAARRTFLFQLTGTGIKGDDIKRRAVIKGADPDLFDLVLPMLRSGFDAAHTEAQRRATDVRSQWCGLTGQPRYGRVIAEDWAPKPPEDYDPNKLLAFEVDVDERAKVIGRKTIDKGGLAARLVDARKVFAGQEDTGEFDHKALKRLEKAVEIADEKAEKLREKRDGLNAQVASAVEKAPVTCIHCGEKMRVSFENVPGQGSTAIVTPYTPLPEDVLTKLRAELMNASEALSTLLNQRTEWIEAANAQRALRDADSDGQPKVTQEQITTMEQAMAGIDTELATLQENQDAAILELNDLRAAATLVKNAEDTKKRAYDLHENVSRWEKVVEVLAPDSIPADILSEALKPVNDRLRQTSIATGWDQVSLDPTLEIITNGRPYSLLGESAKWKADVALTEAFAVLSGVKLMVIDRVDVLAPQNRGAFLRWIQKITPEFDTILLFASLKEKPSKLPAGMAVHWVEAGEIAQDAEAAA